MTQEERPLFSFEECLDALDSPLQRQTVSALIKVREKLGSKDLVSMLLGMLTHTEMLLRDDVLVGEKEKKEMVKHFFPEKTDEFVFDDIIKEVRKTFVELTLDERLGLLGKY